MTRRAGNSSDNPRLKDLLEVSAKGSNDLGLKYEPRCKVCQKGQEFVGMVNSLLATGSSYADVLRAIQPVNEQFEEKRRVSYQSLISHQKRHMPFDAYAVRQILEARAEKQGIDFENAAIKIVTPAAYAQVMMNKAFEKLAKDEEEITIRDGLVAAKTFHNITRGEDQTHDVVELVAQLNRIIDAVKQVASPEQMMEITAILASKTPEQIEAVEGEDYEFDDEEV